MEQLWKYPMYQCARCGKKIHPHTHIKNIKLFVILGKEELLSFCDTCNTIIKDGGK